MHLGIAHHLGWAVAIIAAADGSVVERRRIALLEPGVPPAPVEHEIAALDDVAALELLARVKASAVRATAASLQALASDMRSPVVSISLRAWPLDFPQEISVLRRAPYNSQADSVMYRRVLAEVAVARQWAVHLYDGNIVEAQAADIIGERAKEVLHGPRTRLGPPWTKDHRVALAAAIVVAGTGPRGVFQAPRN